jgi:Tol biopolymer transport system component
MSHTAGANYQIKMMNTDGTSVKSVGSPGAYLAARLSPDGTKIVFALSQSGGNQIGIMNVDGSNSTMLTTSGNNTYPQFTPDGKKVVYQTWGTSSYDIVVINIDGTGKATFHNAGHTSSFPTVSPDGKTIAFCIDLSSGGQGVATMNIDGTGLQLVVNVTGGYVSQMAYSADGSKILFSYTTDTTGKTWGNVYSVSATATNVTATSGLTALTTGNFDGTPVVVGSKVLFMSGRASATPTWDSIQIYSMNPDGSNVTQLTHDTLADVFFSTLS